MKNLFTETKFTDEHKEAVAVLIIIKVIDLLKKFMT
jgi:hypothetical protein